MIDSHIHIDSEVYQKDGGVGQILASAKAKGVSRIVTPAIHLESFSRLRELSGQHPEIFPAAGVHPHDATLERCENLTSKLDRALEESAHPILGETGLEGHYDFVPEELQLQSLRRVLWKSHEAMLVPIGGLMKGLMIVKFVHPYLIPLQKYVRLTLHRKGRAAERAGNIFWFIAIMNNINLALGACTFVEARCADHCAATR